jgi:hypothetical protein
MPGEEKREMQNLQTTQREGRTVRGILLAFFTLGLVLASSGPVMAQPPGKQPNILVIWGAEAWQLQRRSGITGASERCARWKQVGKWSQMVLMVGAEITLVSCWEESERIA